MPGPGLSQGAHQPRQRSNGGGQGIPPQEPLMEFVRRTLMPQEQTLPLDQDNFGTS